MGMTNPTEGQPAYVDSDKAEKIEAIAQSLVAMFGDRALAVIGRQVDASTEIIRLSWAEILTCVNRVLVTPRE